MTLHGERGAASALSRGIVLVLVWAFFITALYISARQGVELALRRLPRTEGTDRERGGEVVRVTSEKIVFGESARELRDYYFTVAAGRVDSPGVQHPGILIAAGELELRLGRRDLDLYEVEVISGPFSGRKLWLHHESIPLAAGAAGSDSD
ncbi:MAG: hypothetical protein ACC661_02135 [Verrucomicrobiales bacterium]